MAGFAGSRSLDERRRRRIAADDSPQTAPTPSDPAGKPLPARRPTGRFPLRRVVSRSPWKLAAVALLVFAACGAAFAAGHVPPIQAGVYGPGLAAFCSPQSGRLATSLGGLLLLATGQLAGLIRWARARSLRDFRGGYRIWWWTSLALTAGGVAVLTEAHTAFAATLVWLTGRSPFGSDAIFRLLPGMAALVVLLPSLQRDMRGCRTSRLLVVAATLFWLAGGGTLIAGERASGALVRFGVTLPADAVASGLLLAGTVAAFSGLLFHARHVVYESVEPPDLPARRRKPITKASDDVTSPEKKSKRTSSRRSARAKAEESVEAPEPKTAKPAANNSEKTTLVTDAPAKPFAKPHFAASTPPTKPVPKVEPAVVRQPPKAAEPDRDWDDGETAAESGGRQFRLDGPEDPLKGLSKRERRKLRKAMKPGGPDDE